MTQPASTHRQQLEQFGEAQLAGLSTRDICASTVHLILSTAFFIGAAIAIAKPLKASKTIYLASLREFLEKHFGLSAKNAAGMIESNARLYKRYTLIENIYNAGVRSAIDWCEDPRIRDNRLKGLIAQYHDLSMSGLNIEGIKEPVVAPVEVEAIIHVEPAVVIPVAEPRWGRRLFWLVLFGLIASASYFVLFPEHIPPQLVELLPEKLRALLLRWSQ